MLAFWSEIQNGLPVEEKDSPQAPCKFGSVAVFGTVPLDTRFVWI